MHFSFQRFLYNVNLLGTHSKIEELKNFSVDNLNQNICQGCRNVFKDTEDKTSFFLNLMGTSSKIGDFQGFLPKYGWDMSLSPHMFQRPCL